MKHILIILTLGLIGCTSLNTQIQEIFDECEAAGKDPSIFLDYNLNIVSHRCV